MAKLEKDLEVSRQREDEITEHLREAEDHIDHLEGKRRELLLKRNEWFHEAEKNLWERVGT